MAALKGFRLHYIIRSETAKGKINKSKSESFYAQIQKKPKIGLVYSAVKVNPSFSTY